MESKDLTLWQTTKVWWSHLWRTWLLMIPAAILWILCIFAVAKLAPEQMPSDKRHVTPAFFLLWGMMVVLMWLGQIMALRWALRAKWSDFRLVVRPPTDS